MPDACQIPPAECCSRPCWARWLRSRWPRSTIAYAEDRLRMIQTIEAHAQSADRCARPRSHRPPGARRHGRGAAPRIRPAGRGPRLRGPAAADRLWPDHLAALHRRADDRPAATSGRTTSCSRSAPARATRRRSSPGSAPGLHDRDHPGAGRRAPASGLQRLGYDNVATRIGRRLLRLAGGGALRRHRRHRRRQPCAAAADRSSSSPAAGW